MQKQRPNSGKVRTSFVFFLVAVFIAAIFLVAYFFPPRSSELVYENVETERPRLNYVETPEAVRGIYMTACIASREELRGKLIKSIEGTEINTVVIDIKDYSGTISIPTVDTSLKTDASRGCHYKDAAAFIKELHDKKYYVIGRISVFQDPYYAAKHPELAVQKKSDGSIWRDRKGLAFIDVSARPYWEYIVKLGKEARDMGFDELNFDYIRFPSDGDMTDIAFPWTKDTDKKEALRLFFGYLRKQFRGTGAVLSADLFGMTTYATGDMNIGQYLEFALPYFDYVSPMVYPSHYPPQWNGYANPAAKPYEVVKYSMDKAYERASSTPRKLRPWLQDFNLGATYTAEMVKAQMKAVYDSGLNSWMLWSPSNKYTAGALNYARD